MKRSISAESDPAKISRRQQAEQEIQTFLEALNSYPERFALDPYLSFEEHMIALGSGQRENSPAAI